MSTQSADVTQAPQAVESAVSVKTYVNVGIVLAALTALEVACIYIPALSGVLPLILIGVGIIKFILVAMYFMHLKFDAKVYTIFFIIGAIMAIGIFIGLLGMNPPPGHELITPS